jgi:hypothetical protein
MLSDFHKFVNSMHLNHGVQNALITKLSAALHSVEKDKVNACGQLDAFVNQVQGLALITNLEQASCFGLIPSFTLSSIFKTARLWLWFIDRVNWNLEFQ